MVQCGIVCFHTIHCSMAWYDMAWYCMEERKTYREVSKGYVIMWSEVVEKRSEILTS